MTTSYNKSFVNHKHNGVYLKFPNGNGISTVWGYSNYCENYNNGELGKFNNGSDTCEILPEADEKTIKKLYKICPELKNNNVAGHLTMEDWLKVVKILSK